MVSEEYSNLPYLEKFRVAEFLANPENAQMTLEEVSNLLGFPLTLLIHWSQESEFQKYILRVRQLYFDCHRKFVDITLFEKAREGNIQAMKLFYELGGYFDLKPEDLREPEGLRIIIEHPEIDSQNPS